MRRRNPLPMPVDAVRGILLLIMHSWQAARALHFEHASFDSASLQGDIIAVGEGAWYTGQDAGFTDGAIWLNPDPNDLTTLFASNIGRVVYKDPINFTAATSFSTRFSFQIITTAKYGLCGSGLAFFIQDARQAPPYSRGRYLGLFDPHAVTQTTRFFAVEFDTHTSANLHDPSASHIGIDINSLVSVCHADSSPGTALFPQLFLYNNSTFTVWVDYNSSSNLTQVWMTRSDTTTAPARPSHPILNLTDHNLSALFEGRPVYIGFSGSNNASEDGMQGAAIFSWSFTSDEGSSGSSRSESKRRSAKLIFHVIAPVMGACFLVLMLAAIATLGVSNKAHNCMGLSGEPQQGGKSRPDINLQGRLQRQYTLKELKRATNNFSKEAEIGRGAFGVVYKGVQPDGSQVAVKKLKSGVRREDEFVASMTILGTCRHKNILELQGWYNGKRGAMLVYKFMPNSSLDEYLYGGKKDTVQLPSAVRLKILAEVSLALGYMHTDLDECVLHRDVKAANVLLADGFKAILGDFGLACLADQNGEVLTTTPAGTLGYIAPELLTEGRATAKSDVYSFGVLALEMAYGRRVIETRLQPSEEPQDSLLQWVWKLKQSGQHVKALDPRMGIDKLPADEMQKWMNVLHVAFLCCDPLAEGRPTMKEVSQVLQGDGDGQRLLLQPLPFRAPVMIDHRTLQFVNSTSNAVFFSATASIAQLCDMHSSGYAPLTSNHDQHCRIDLSPLQSGGFLVC